MNALSTETRQPRSLMPWWLSVFVLIALAGIGVPFATDAFLAHRDDALTPAPDIATRDSSPLPSTSVIPKPERQAVASSLDTGTTSNSVGTPTARTTALPISPWAAPALCGRNSPQKTKDWLAYLRGLKRVELPTVSHWVKDQPMDIPVVKMYADTTVDAEATERLALLLGMARSRVASETGLDVPPPIVFVHRNVETLRQHSCLTSNAVAFYDGSLHVSNAPHGRRGNVQLYYTVIHEYTHHALISNGVREPLWFQEGLAMHLSGEPIIGFDISSPEIPVAEMVDAFPYTVSPKLAERIYGQAYQMVDFLMVMCRRTASPYCSKRALVERLRAGADPNTFFESTIQELDRDSDVAPLARWQTYFSQLTKQ